MHMHVYTAVLGTVIQRCCQMCDAMKHLLPVVLVVLTYAHLFSSICATPMVNGACSAQSALTSSGHSSNASTCFVTSNSLPTTFIPLSISTNIPASISDSMTSNGTFSATPTSSLLFSMSTSTAATPTSNTAVQQDIDTIRERHLSAIVGGLSSSAGSIYAWLSSLGQDGKWPDSEVDYTTGCAARRANWPAQDHWQRIVVMAAAWHGGLESAEQFGFVNDNVTRTAISRAMDY